MTGVATRNVSVAFLVGFSRDLGVQVAPLELEEVGLERICTQKAPDGARPSTELHTDYSQSAVYHPFLTKQQLGSANSAGGTPAPQPCGVGLWPAHLWVCRQTQAERSQML